MTNMKNLKILFLLILMVMPVFAAKIKSGEELIVEMHKKYESKWYKTLTFVQKTTNYKEDGTSVVSTWYEALSVPGKLRIDFDPLEKGGGILFVDGMLHSFRDGKLAGSRPFAHPLLILGFDVYGQPVEKTIGQIKDMKIDLSVVHEEMWDGNAVYVVGAKQGDLKTPQFWVDKKNLYFVRLIELAGKDKQSIHETQFNKYIKMKSGGWVSAEVQFFVDGKRATTEEYSDIQTGVSLDANLYDPSQWMTADRKYFQKK
jgi:outer membrane lipoprotein-sorting protein